MNKNTIPLIIVIICFGLGGLGLVIHNIKNDVKHPYYDDGHGETSGTPVMESAEPEYKEDSHKKEDF